MDMLTHATSTYYIIDGSVRKGASEVVMLEFLAVAKAIANTKGPALRKSPARHWRRELVRNITLGPSSI